MADPSAWNLPAGSVGQLFDDTPRLHPAQVRPFIWAYLLMDGEVCVSDVAKALTGHLAPEDMRVGFDENAADEDATPAEALIRSVIEEFVSELLLEESPSGDGKFILTDTAIARVLSMTCSLNAALPARYLNRVAEKERAEKGLSF